MTKVKSFILASLAMWNIVPAIAQFGTGYAFNPKANTGPSLNSTGFGFSSDVPASYSLKMFAPYAKSQGIYPSCSGWAVSYEALSIQYAMAYGISNRNHITAKAFCPYYSYNKELPVDPNCKTGKNAAAMMGTIKNEGAKKFYLPVLGCGSALADEFSYASKYYKIKEYYSMNVWPKDLAFDENDMAGSWKRFFEAPHPMDLKVVKQCISGNYPVVIGAVLPTSFYSAGELWEPTAEERANPSAAVMDNTGGHRLHAMTVVGYDDNKFGGAFEVMNSWSESWGDNGFYWVKYDDFKMYTFSAMIMDLFPAEADLATKTGVLWGDCSNGYGFYRFPNGETYEGQFKDGRYHGYGIYTWPNGMAYAGQWNMGMRSGEATCYYTGGTFGQAIYDNDTFVSGYNELLYVNGNSYKGYLKNGKFEGYGEYRFSSGERYLAMFSNGNLNGLAKYFANDGSSFLGFYTDGKRNGKGIIVSSAGQISAGDWSYGVYQREKTYGFADGSNFNAATQMSSNMYLAADCLYGNCLMGEGKRVMGNGTTYTGSFVDGLEDGKGEMLYSDGSYNGSWKQGKEHGIGEMKFNNGVNLISEFKKGKIDGYVLKYDNAGNMGVYLFSNGAKLKSFNELTTIQNTNSSADIPSALESVPSIVKSIK